MRRKFASGPRVGRECAEFGVVAGNDTELRPTRRGIAGTSTFAAHGPRSDPQFGDPTRIARRRMGVPRRGHVRPPPGCGHGPGTNSFARAAPFANSEIDGFRRRVPTYRR